MPSFNKVILIGRLTRDPELRYTPAGVPVSNFAIAVDRTWGKDKQTDFFNIVAWQKLAEICQQYLTKGRLVAVDGRLQVRNYETQDGQKRTAVEIVANDLQILDRAPKPEDAGTKIPVSVPAGAAVSGSTGGSESPPPQEPPLADDVPF